MKTFLKIVSVIGLFISIFFSSASAVEGIPGYDEGHRDPRYVRFGEFSARLENWGHGTFADKATELSVKGLTFEYNENEIELIRFEVIEGVTPKVGVYFKSKNHGPFSKGMEYMSIDLSSEALKSLIVMNIHDENKRDGKAETVVPDEMKVKYAIEKIVFRPTLPSSYTAKLD